MLHMTQYLKPNNTRGRYFNPSMCIKIQLLLLFAQKSLITWLQTYRICIFDPFRVGHSNSWRWTKNAHWKSMKSRNQKIGFKLLCKLIGDNFSSYRLQIMWFFKIWNPENIFFQWECLSGYWVDYDYAKFDFGITNWVKLNFLISWI